MHIFGGARIWEDLFSEGALFVSVESITHDTRKFTFRSGFSGVF